LNFVGPGFKDFTRIAGGPFEMWTEICLENREEIGRALDALIEELAKCAPRSRTATRSNCARCSNARSISGMN
jgi:prephenate dehydrogenase